VLTAFARAFQTPDLRKKLMFTLGIVVLFRFGAHIPTPGVSYENVQYCADLVQDQGGAGLFGLVNMFSGGALLQLTIFALGIMPYITASIILQLLVVVIPRLEALKKEGQAGQAKITQYTRYLTVALAVLQATGLVATARGGTLFSGCDRDIIPNNSVFTTLVMIITLTSATALIMWLGELITDRGIGNGMSMLMFVSIAAGFPGALWAIKTQGSLADGWIEFGVVVACGLAMVGLVVFVELAQRRIPVQYAKRMIGRRSYGGTSTYIPLKVNQAGVIPVIFASSLLYIPALLVQFSDAQGGWSDWIQRNLIQMDSPIYIISYFLLIVFFAFFYVAITFNPEDVAENMKKYGGFIPGVRAGRPTVEYLSYVLNRITWPGATYLGLIALVPTVALILFNAQGEFPFGGTSILIIVGVGLETVRQIESQLHQRNYEGFLR
jgi:preprotein translocase subunit SecY